MASWAGSAAPATGSGIAPSSVPMFVLMQLLGGLAALGLIKVLYPGPTRLAADLVSTRQ